MKAGIILSLLLFLSAADSWANQSIGLGSSSVVSTTDPRLRVPSGATVRWKESAVKIYHDDRFDSGATTSIYRNAVEKAIGEKGYQPAARR